jgi:VanZ family protein
MRSLFRVAAWLLLLSIVVLSVVPPEYRPVTPAPHDVEHLSIFLLTGVAFGLGYEKRHFLQILALVAFSAAIEIIQLGIPGRHGRLSDFVVDALSASIGVGLAVAVAAYAGRFRSLGESKG